MKQRALSCSIWLVTLIAATLLNDVASRLFFVPAFGPPFGEYQKPLPTIALTFAIFSVAGCLVAWGMRWRPTSTIAALALGTISLALEVALGVPWFTGLNLPSHVPVYAYLLGFLAALAAPCAAAGGAYWACRYHAKRPYAA